MKRWLVFYFANGFLSLIFLFFITTSVIACGKDPECGDPTAWSGFSHVSLKMLSSGYAGISEWQGYFNHDNNDILIDINSSGGEREPKQGSIAMLGGRVMLSKGLDLKPGYEIDAIDAPILSIKLVMILLGRVFPQGPSKILEHENIDYTANLAIKYATPSASAYIPAPWQLKGSIDKLEDGKFSFKLQLAFAVRKKAKSQNSVKKNSFNISLQGKLAQLGRPVFLDTQSLYGWVIYGVGPRQFKQAQSTIMDYAASPKKDMKYKTIGDIRAYIAGQNHPGEKDPSKDFSGFWKQKCTEAFGLRIMHQGDEGKYSVVFCGPGGCADSGNPRLTFINGDKRWQVISEDQLIEIQGSGEVQTYYRCSKETEPKLEY